MKMKLLWSAIALGALLALVLGTTALAQEEPPAPYAGMKNPFAWDDGSAVAAGQTVYKQSCLGCHGVTGDSLARFNFSKPEFSDGLRARPDYYMWVLSEGRLSQGMPGYKSLSEDQRWQVLTYIDSLGTGAAAGGADAPAAEALAGFLRLSAPEHGQAGEPVSLRATLEDAQGKPVAGAEVSFLVEAQLFTSGLIDIGSATTNDSGVASLQYTPRSSGLLAAVARYGANEGRGSVTVSGESSGSHGTEVGIHLPQLGKGIIYPASVLTLRPGDQAPLPAFRLPGGFLSWMLILVAIVFMIWFTYFRVWYQVFRIPVVGDRAEVNTKLLPTLAMAAVTFIGVGLILKLLISPYTHLHIPMS
jgi:mono/diheme cytochrome c family protein